jgi:hypothetical protein
MYNQGTIKVNAIWTSHTILLETSTGQVTYVTRALHVHLASFDPIAAEWLTAVL